jgi:hypothetical protein
LKPIQHFSHFITTAPQEKLPRWWNSPGAATSATWVQGGNDVGHFENPQYSREFEMNRDDCIYIYREREMNIEMTRPKN